MSGPLLSTLILSMALHAGLIFFGPDIRPPNFEEFKDNSVEVAMLRREVPLPDSLRSKPLPEVPRPNPLNLKRFQESHGNTSELLSPRLRILPPVPTPKKILNAPALSGPPKLNLPRPLTSLDSLGLEKSPVSPSDIVVQISGLKGGGLSGERKSVPVRDLSRSGELLREISRLDLRDRDLVKGQGIEGPVAARKIVFRPPPPKVKISDSSGDIKLRFWVLPDGTVGRVLPMRKGSAYLEGVAVNHLKRWRFSPLPKGAPKGEELGSIVYRFRVR